MARKKQLKVNKTVGFCPSCNKMSLFVKKKKKFRDEETDKFNCVKCEQEFFKS